MLDLRTQTRVTDCGALKQLERTRFFPRQLLDSADMTQISAYFLEKMRRHNRFLHGWGIAYGAWVKPGLGDGEVIVEPGYILSPHGHEIAIPEEVTVNLMTEGPDGSAITTCGEADMWCSEIRVNRPVNQTLYLAVRYDECEVRPVRAMSAGCGCGEGDCEYSRIREGYAFKVLTRLPASYDPMPEIQINSVFTCDDETAHRRYCPPCPADPWVILADITLTGSGKITEQQIDMPPHRRYIAAFGEFYFVCEPDLKLHLGRRPEVEYRVARAGLEEMVNVAGLRAVEERMDNDLTRVTELAVTDLRGVDARSKLGQQLEGMNIAEVAALPLDEFINRVVTDDMNSATRASVRRQATEIHNRAKRVERISTDLKG